MSRLRYQGIDRTAQDIYKNWKNELSEYFKLNGGDKNSLDLPRARCSVSPDMAQEVWNNCIDYFSSEEFRVVFNLITLLQH